MDIHELNQITDTHSATFEQLCAMMGESFMEERWTSTAARALANGNEERAHALSYEVLKGELAGAAEEECLFATDDLAGCCVAYRASELSRPWSTYEDAASARLAADVLTEDERAAAEPLMAKMAPASNFSWEADAAQEAGFSDFVHFPLIGVDAAQRGTGAFRRLVDPVLRFADVNGLPCLLETYTENLAQLYGHFGFEVVRTFSAPDAGLVELGMMRRPAR